MQIYCKGTSLHKKRVQLTIQVEDPNMAAPLISHFKVVDLVP